MLKERVKHLEELLAEKEWLKSIDGKEINMEIWINDKEIAQRITDRIAELSKYEIGINAKDIIGRMLTSLRNMDFTHKDIIEFCIATNTNYRYILIGEYPICDSDNKNLLYEKLIEKSDYTL